MSGPEKPIPEDTEWSALLYALGEGDESSRAEFESRLRTDEFAAAGLAQAVATLLASAAALESDSKRIGPGQAAVRAVRAPRWAMPAAVALGLLVALSGFLWLRELDRSVGGSDAGALAEVAEQWVDVRDAGVADFAPPAGDRDELILAWMGVEDESAALGLPDWMEIAVEAPETDARP